MYPYSRRAFTLIELLVVIAIIAILAVVVVLTLNPAQLLAQSRDANRLSDLATISSAINLYNTDQGGVQTYSLGNASTAYLSIFDLTATSTAGDQCQGLGLTSLPSGSYHCAASSSYRSTDGTGWIPVNFNKISSGSPLGSLPVDPTNQSSSNLFYTYQANSTQYELTAVMESQKYLSVASSDGGTYSDLYEKGSNLSLALMNYGGSGLMPQGWWRFASSTNLGLDSSSQGNTLTVNGSITQTTSPNAYVPSAALLTAASSQYLNRTDANLSAGFPGKSTAGQQSVTVGAWVNPNNSNSADLINKGNAYDLVIEGNGLYPSFLVWDNGNNGHKLDANVGVPSNSWSFVVGVWTQSTGVLKIYINGVNVSGSNVTSATMHANSSALQVGAPISWTGNAYYNGSIAEPFVMRRR
jgi:prepilin-type N-terminal cleavage/methylation domain-containing protein